jgi:hypothetical protein
MQRLLVLLLLAGAASAQERALMTAGDALNAEMCAKIRDAVTPRIEAFTRMKFRRSVPIGIQPRSEWEAAQKQDGFAGFSAKHALAFYNPGSNRVTVVPWVIGGYPGPGQKGDPKLLSVEEWVAELEPTLIHELTHAIHHQNFYSEGRSVMASLRAGGLSEEEIDQSTVQFLLGEGFPELVASRTTEFKTYMDRSPTQDLEGVRHYMKTYKPNDKDPYRVTLSLSGYNDGLTLLHHLQLASAARGVRACLYRPPPRVLLFQPDLLKAVDLEDPPDPDSIFAFLSPELLKGHDVRLAVNPGSGRFFEGAYESGMRVEGCLIGYVAEVGAAGDPNGESRYAFFVADPDGPGEWSGAQASSLKTMNPAGAAEKDVALPLSDKVTAKVITVKMEDGSLYVRAEAGGVVVLAHESKPTPILEERVIKALRALYICKPKPKLYDEAKAKAMAAFEKGSD